MKLSETLQEYHTTDSLSKKKELKCKIENTVGSFFDKLYKEYHRGCEILRTPDILWHWPDSETPYKKSFSSVLRLYGFPINICDGDNDDYSYEGFNIKIEDNHVWGQNHYVYFSIREDILDKIEGFNFEDFNSFLNVEYKKIIAKEARVQIQKAMDRIEEYKKLLEEL